MARLYDVSEPTVSRIVALGFAACGALLLLNSDEHASGGTPPRTQSVRAGHVPPLRPSLCHRLDRKCGACRPRGRQQFAGDVSPFRHIRRRRRRIEHTAIGRPVRHFRDGRDLCPRGTGRQCSRTSRYGDSGWSGPFLGAACSRNHSRDWPGFRDFCAAAAVVTSDLFFHCLAPVKAAVTASA